MIGNKLLILLLLLGITSICYSQDDEHLTAFEKMKNYRDTVAMYLNKNEPGKIEVRRYFDLEAGDTAYLALNEEEILLLITGRYEVLLSDILMKRTRLNSANNTRETDKKDEKAGFIYNNTNAYSYYYSDILAETIINYIRNNKLQLQENIKKSGLEADSRDFLLLLFDYYLVISDFCDIYMEQKMLSEAGVFLENYPESRYVAFVEDYIDIEFLEGKWGFGLFINAGTILYTNGLKDTFKNPFLFFASFDINYRKINLNLGMGGTVFSSVKQDFFHDTLWKNNHQYSVAPLATVTLGYHVYETENFRITPSLGAGIMAIHGRARGDSLYYDGIRLLSKNPLTISVAIDYKFGQRTCKPDNTNRRGRHKQNIFADIRLKVSYQNPQFDKDSEKLKGSVLFLTLGAGFNSYPPKKVMKKN
ncbi:MAG: hypothetical protein LBQ22_04315 [Bacteroidales bacterium]|nr:hypothetical protein [Bacteroidales bacterium]